MMNTETIHLGLRKIGRVQVFDLTGALIGEDMDPVIGKIEQTIQKKKLRRVILNLQKATSMDEMAVRRLVACLLRPQRSLIFAPGDSSREQFKSTYLPQSIRLCRNEEEVAEAFGSFLFLKDKIYQVPVDETKPQPPSYGLERRRSKRIRVAIPIKMKFQMKDGSTLEAKAIATNVSQGGLFAEFLDLNSPDYSKMEGLEGSQVTIMVPANDHFQEEMVVPGRINRFELMKKQYGIAVQFV